MTGYEYEKNHYVVVDRKEIDKEADGDHSIAVETFIEPGEIDPMYFDGRTYFLAPANKASERPYGVLHEAMAKLHRFGVATVTLNGKQHPVLIRPVPKDLIPETEFAWREQYWSRIKAYLAQAG